MSTFDEGLHPRGQAGQFRTKPKAGAGVALDAAGQGTDSADLAGWLETMTPGEQAAVNRFLDQEAAVFGTSRDQVPTWWDDSEGIAFDESRHVGEALAETLGPKATFDIVHDPSGVPLAFRVSHYVGMDSAYEITRRYPTAHIGDGPMAKADGSSREGLRIYASVYDEALDELRLQVRSMLR